LELASRQTRRALEKRRRTLRERSLPALRSVTTTTAFTSLAWQVEPVYAIFETQFDDLIGIVCAAANEGNGPGFEAGFARCRSWWVQHYAWVKPHLAPFIEYSPADVAPAPTGQTVVCDPFEALWWYPSLATLLHADNGHLIDRLMRVQNAAEAWRQEVLGVGS
jgi:hypothetical protein